MNRPQSNPLINDFKENVISSIPEQFADAAKAHFEAQLQMFNALTSKVFEGVEKVIELNVTAAKEAVGEISSVAREMGAAKDPQAFLSTSVPQVQPNAEKALDYGRHLTEIGQSIHTEFAVAAETQIAETRKKLVSLVEEAAKNAPAGSESTIAMMQSILGNADTGYEQLMKSSRQAAETLQKNVQTANEKMATATEDTQKTSRK